MKIFRGIQSLRAHLKKPVVAIGVFDGLHLGHQRLIRTAVAKARDIRGTSVVMTFHPHPVHVLHPESGLSLLVSLPYRLKLVEAIGVDACLVVPFTKRFSRLLPEIFIKKLIVDRIGARAVIVGDDFRFGKDRTGTMDLFHEAGRRYGFEVLPVHLVNKNHHRISSTRIRRLISRGRFEDASRFLGRPYAFYSRVIRGDGRGRALGYPTANLLLSGEVIPPVGVYLMRVFTKRGMYLGIANVGRRPSFRKISPLTLEVHLLDFQGNLYGHDLLVEFVKKIRNERIFPSRDALIGQIRRDEATARRFFARSR
ncbi:MAG: bifunctional riboflavin kinase/FAD synthetase [Candidatus Omnitrophota bacterium]|nr:bifunctional riboflavin kinase/FAD synthetase [Candidatus Omnitrophota bacterium]